MSSIASLGRMVSGLTTAQKGLQVTGHNITNVNTKGYIRQQLLQHDSFYLNIGGNGKLLQVGTGVTPTEIRQIRDELADKRYRTENAVLNFYQTKNGSIQEVESILDEPYGEGISKMLENFWAQTQKLSTSPSEVEERSSFIQAANVLIKKANQISDALATYQDNLNTEVKNSVNHINALLKGIQECNEAVNKGELNGDRANDYRDQRNLLLDELSGYMEIDYYEEPDGRVVVKAEGQEVINKQFITTLELEQTVAGSSFVKPVWSNTKADVFKFNETITPAKENDTGKLKGLLAARGDQYVNAGTTWDDIALNNNLSVDTAGNSYFIPKINKKLNDFVNELVTMCNDSFDGQGIGTHVSKTGVPMFVPIKASRPPLATVPPTEGLAPNTSSATYDAEMVLYKNYLNNISDCMISGNIKINPELLEEGGYNKLGTVDPTSTDVGNNSKVMAFLAEWNTTRDWPEKSADPTVSPIPSSPYAKKVNIMSYYAEFVTEIGLEGSIYKQKASEKETTVMNIDNERQSMGAVSQDEEFTNMLKYQYAYNASARMITMLDGMMDTIINKM